MSIIDEFIYALYTIPKVLLDSRFFTIIIRKNI